MRDRLGSNVQHKMMIARWSFYTLTLIITISLSLAAAAQPKFAVEVIAPAPQTALPGELLTLVFVVINRGTEPDTYNLRALLPEGFQIIGIAPPTASLAPGAQDSIFVTLLISQDTPAGKYMVALEALSQSDSSVKAAAATTIIVEKTAGVIVQAPDQQEVDPGTEIILTFSITNRGNAIDVFRCDAATPRGFVAKVEPSLVELLPGETRSALVTVRIPEDISPGFETVTLTVVSLRNEGIKASSGTMLIILPPEATKVPTVLYLHAPAELSVRANVTLGSGTITPLISFITYAAMPEEQRFSLRMRISELTRTQIPTGLPLNVQEFLFTSQRGAFFVHVGDLPRMPLIYNALPRRGIELGFTDAFSLLATSEDQQRAMGLNFLGQRVRASLTRLSIAGSNAYILTAANFLSALLSTEGAMAETSVGFRRMFFIRAAPNFNTFVLGGEYLFVEPDFPNIGGTPSALADTQTWTFFGSGSVTALTLSLRASGQRTDLFSDPAVQEVTSFTSQAQLTIHSLLLGWPSLLFNVEFTLRRSDDPLFPPLSTDEDSKSLTIADISSPMGYFLSFRSNSSRDNFTSTHIKTFEFISSLIISPLPVGIEGLSCILNNSAIFQRDNLGTPIQQRVTAAGRLAFTTTRVSAFLSMALVDDLLSPDPMSLFGSFGLTLFEPLGASFAFAFTEPSSLSFTLEVRTKFAMPFESVIIRGRVEGYLFIDLNNNGQRDPGEPGVNEALLRLDNQLARTNEQGYFRFPPVDPGVYRVEIARAPLGLVPTVPIPIPVTVAIGQIVTLEIPMRSIGIIRGRVFDDKNRNGQADPDEPGLANVRIFAVGATSVETRSSANGQYILQVSPGSYTVTLDRTTLPKRYEPTTPLSVTVSVQTGQMVTIDFGAHEVPRPVLFAPIADFTFTPAQPKVGEKVTFDASASTDSDGQIVRYEWDFTNDGKPDAVGKIVEWVFTSAGDFPVKLTVTDNDDLQNSITKIVPVQP